MTLSHRAEQAKPEEARELLEELAETVRPGWQFEGGSDWLAAFMGLIYEVNTPEAHLAAAMMLVPEGCVWSVQTDFGLPGRARLWGSVLPGQIQDCGWSADGATPALALIAAIARSQGQ